MQDKLLSFLGLARKAGKLNIGSDAVINSILKLNSKLVLFASDASQNTVSKILKYSKKNNIVTLFCNRTKNDFYNMFNRQCAVLSVNDENFSKKICSLIKEETK
ncbi:MAG: ribosomal L7Ae/L30e/S12e/Gadd45 family protein [Clostridia bacterium]|nr:ribosomal L7Ae/L30e/S12e/Gadd45 family protein [Clostridia bacterium]